MEIIETQFDLLLEEFDNIAKFKGRSLDIVHGIADGVIDVVYIDGLHTYEGVKADIPAWLPKLKQGGFLCGHDYQSKFQGVIDAVNEFKTPDMTFGDTSWVIKI